MSTDKIKELESQMSAYRQAEEKAEAVGVRMFEVLTSSIPADQTNGLSRALGSLLNQLDIADGERDCTKLLHEWMMDHFYEYQLDRAKGTFLDLFDKLTEIGATYDDRLVYGDMDYGVWAGTFADGTKYIGHECYCACSDENVYLYFADNMNFHCRKISPSAMKKIEKEKTLKQYGDGRDPGYCFSVEIWDFPDTEKHVRAKDTLFAYFNIYWALWTLRGTYCGLEHPLELPKK